MTLPLETRTMEWRRDEYVLSTDRARLDLDRIHRFLAEESYWARGVTRDVVARSIDGALSLGIYREGGQVGFARVVTDCTRVAYLMDVFIDEEHRGRGLGTWLARVIRTHPDLAGVTRWLLATKDAHEVYQRAGWTAVRHPEWLMEVLNTRAAQPDVATGAALAGRA
jgi:GNAT superfamily N-acetyltransferase